MFILYKYACVYVYSDPNNQLSCDMTRDVAPGRWPIIIHDPDTVCKSCVQNQKNNIKEKKLWLPVTHFLPGRSRRTCDTHCSVHRDCMVRALHRKVINLLIIIVVLVETIITIENNHRDNNELLLGHQYNEHTLPFIDILFFKFLLFILE